MLKTLEATIDKNGTIRLKEKIKLRTMHKALVTILEEDDIEEITLLSEKALAKDWNKPEEDKAWKHLK